jgi:type I restriction enzyme S subunit
VIHDLKPYPAYKDSGVPWLGEVPATWKINRNSGLFTQRNETGFGDLPILEVSLNTGVRVRDFDGNGRKQVMADRGKYKRARRGDLAYNMMRMWQGAVGLAPVDGLVSPAYVVARPFPAVEPRFFEYLFRTDTYMGEVDKFSHGIVKDRNRLYWEDFKQMPSPVPPPEEQVAIVRFLDHADRRIRRYIRAKQKLIALLNEEEQVIIHHAVTRGLPSTGSGQATPNVRLKPSGVEWLGNVPEHWEIAALRHRYSQCLGKMLDSKRFTGISTLPYLRNTDVQWDRINIEDLPIMDIPPAEYVRYTVQQGDLLVCEGGEVGRCAIWSGELSVCGFQKALHRLRPLNAARDVPRFMYYALRAAAKGNAFNDGHLSTIAHLTGDKLRAHRFPFPPVAEQEALVSFLDAALKQVDQAISTAYREISLLREYRTRLIADVVTGKLDVREAAARLPEEAEEPEPPDKADILSDAEEEPADERDAVPEEAEG